MDELAPKPDVRVILAGRTGLDASLRLDPGIELLRVRTALEAIGELSDPIDEASPARAVIIVGADADPGAHVNGHGGSRAEFIKAARILDAGVRILRAMEHETPADDAVSREYDGVIDPASSASAISALVRGRSTADRDAASPTPPHTSPRPPGPAAPAPAGAASRPDFAPPGLEPAGLDPADEPAVGAGGPLPMAPMLGDGSLLRILLRGGDIGTPAVALVRARTADDGLVFIRAGESLPANSSPVPVACDGVNYGHLWSARTLPEELRLHAEWLALWLRLADQQAQLREAAFTDSLTGAWNRRYFDRYLTAAMARARAARQPVTVMCFDIDDFKRFNDAYGHAAADEILIETVRLLRSVIRPSDRVCRVGGDEFAVIFHEPGGPRKPGSAPPTTVFEIARRFQEQICESRFPKLGVEAPGTLTVSGGLATFPWDGTTPEELIRHADMLALESKRSGKNAIVFGPHGSDT